MRASRSDAAAWTFLLQREPHAADGGSRLAEDTRQFLLKGVECPQCGLWHGWLHPGPFLFRVVVGLMPRSGGRGPSARCPLLPVNDSGVLARTDCLGPERLAGPKVRYRIDDVLSGGADRLAGGVVSLDAVPAVLGRPNEEMRVEGRRFDPAEEREADESCAPSVGGAVGAALRQVHDVVKDVVHDAAGEMQGGVTPLVGPF